MKIKIRNLVIILLLILISGVFNQSKAALPTLIRPANNSFCALLTDTLFWHSVPNKLSYKILISTQSDMANDFISVQPADTFFVPSGGAPGLAEGNQYWWRVIVAVDVGVFDSSDVWTFTTKYPAPTLSLPDDNALCQPKKVNLQWNYDTGFQFRLQVSTTNTFTSTVADIVNIATNSQTVTLPNYNTKYYWRVSAMNQSCTSNWSTVRNFTLSPNPPTLISPANHSSGNQLSVPFKWSASGSPVSYEIQVASDTNFLGIITDDIVNSPMDTINLYSFNREYYWRVKTSYSGCETEWSNFSILKTVYSAPILILPKRDSNCVPQVTKVEWIQASGASAYRLQVAEDMNFTNIVINIPKIVNLADTITLPKGLFMYYWRVRGEDSINTGMWSDTFKFVTAVGVPERIVPLDKDSGGTTVTFKWNPIDVGISYRIQISNYPDFKTNMLDQRLDPDSLQYTFPSYNKTYYWRVTGNYIQCASPWSTTWTYRTLLLPPNLLQPADKSIKISTSPKFQWTAPQGSEKFVFQLSKNPSFSPIIVGRNGLPGTNLLIETDLETNTTYYWRVYCTNSEGASSWSKISTFTTGGLGPDIPVLIYPNNNTEGWDTDIQLKWNASQRATLYHLQVSENDDFQKCFVDLDNIAETTYPLKGLKNAKTYYWRVEALNNNGSSNWTEPWSFRTLALAPSDTAQLQLPPDSSKNLPVEINFSWAPVTRAEIYEFQIATDIQFNTQNIIYADSNLSVNSKYLTAIPYNSELFWRVRGRNDAGNGPWSIPWRFKTIINSVSDERLAAEYNININPNPANESASIAINLIEEQNISVKIFNLLGVELSKTDVVSTKSGLNVVKLDLRNMKSGAYLIKISIGTFSQVQNLIIEK